MVPWYMDLHELVSLINQPQRNAFIDAYVTHVDLVIATPGARKKHQAWESGYLDHVVYAANYALVLHELNASLGFIPDHDRSDIILVIGLHDFGKLVRYTRLGDHYGYVARPDEAEKDFLKHVLEDFDFNLTAIQKNALEFVHGEGAKYTPDDKLMLPLATLCHQADVWSARYAHDRPSMHDSWQGAYRHAAIKNLKDYVLNLSHLKD